MRGRRALDAGGGDPVAACDVGKLDSGKTAGQPSSEAADPDPATALRNVDEQVRKLTREQLVVLWQRRWRRSPPKGISRRLLECNAAWLIQSETQGVISSATRRRLTEMARAGKDDGKRTNQSAMKPSRGRRTAHRQLRPGSRLVRQWKGQTHVVDVVESGFSFDGRTFNSLTAIAFEITGARWSGPRFFGLDRTKRHTTRDAAKSVAPVTAQDPSSNAAASQDEARSDA